ncbi:transcriptional regulator [Nocardiopsis sp. CNR-923]|uniref:transcriptional regulator n=1 Tax=Nocardiopsis sp. CNR-923 TaxID=1904965 RepID=UPI00096603F3|nr:transcriptional regulator [Nocardiopsis sp. CNR-923]OLT25588.1 transcriptional regulator [Nocardiopsis sp. CNR-923]
MSAEDSSSRPSLALVALAALCLLCLTAGSHPDSSDVPAEGRDDGMQVLRRASLTEDELSYTAVRTVSGPAGGTGTAGRTDREIRLRVVSRPGQGIALARLGEGVDGGDAGGEFDGAFVVRDSSELDALDGRLLRMLEDTYRVTDAGPAELDGRAVRLVEADRSDGSVAGRFWVDADTGLLVGRTVYEESGEVALSSRLTDVRVGEGDWPVEAHGGEPWGDVLTPDERDALRDGDWCLPEDLTWNLRLVDARSTYLGEHRVVHAIYSDGLSQVSVFAQRGKLGTEHPSTHRDGHTGTGAGGGGATTRHGGIFGGDVGQYQSVWQSEGFVFAVLADAPAGLASSAVIALPGPESSGFWARVRRGLSRWGVP